jgi:uncharacterized protein (TIGR02217 family)
MSFTEERLELGITYGTTATITTSTAVVENYAGAETRSINWVQPLVKFNIGQRGCINQELEYFIAFHQARKGAFEGFRFKDWSDYQFNTEIILNEDLQAQLFKSYTVGGFSVKRPLAKVVEGTVTVLVGTEPVTTGWELDYTTGVITFEELPTGNIRVIGEFDVPVRFENDKLDLRFEAYEPGTGRKIFNWESLSLIEVRIPPTIPLPFDPVPQSLNYIIDLGYDYGTVGGNKFATRIERLVSGQEQRTSEWSGSRSGWEVGSRTLVKSELDYLIALFRVCRGKAVSFRYFDWGTESEVPVRFGEDAIAFRFDAYERGTGRVIFNLAGVPLAGLPIPVTIKVHLFGTYVIKPKTIGINDNFGCGDTGYWRTWVPAQIITSDSISQLDFVAEVTGNSAWTLFYRNSPNTIGFSPISSEDYFAVNTGNIAFIGAAFGSLPSITFSDTCGTGTNFNSSPDGDNIQVVRMVPV